MAIAITTAPATELAGYGNGKPANILAHETTDLDELFGDGADKEAGGQEGELAADALPFDVPSEETAATNEIPADPINDGEGLPIVEPVAATEAAEPTTEKTYLPSQPARPTEGRGETVERTPLAGQLADIRDCEATCRDCEAAVNSIKEELKAAKKEYDGAVIKLRKLCAAIGGDLNRPLLDRAENAAGDPDEDEEDDEEGDEGEAGQDEEAAATASEAAELPSGKVGLAGDAAGVERIPSRIKLILNIPLDNFDGKIGEEHDCFMVEEKDEKGGPMTSLCVKDETGKLIALESAEYEVIAWEDGGPANAASGDGDNTDGPARNADTDLSWRDVQLADLHAPSLAKGILTALADANIETVGQLSDYQKKEHSRLTDIKGIGEGKLVKIDEALVAFWARWGKGEKC